MTSKSPRTWPADYSIRTSTQKWKTPNNANSPQASSTTSSPTAPISSPPHSQSGDGDDKINSHKENPSDPTSSGHRGAATHSSNSEPATPSTASMKSKPQTQNAVTSSPSSTSGGAATPTPSSKPKTSPMKSSSSSTTKPSTNRTAQEAQPFSTAASEWHASSQITPILASADMSSPK